MGVDFCDGLCENGCCVEQYKSKFNIVCRRCQSLCHAMKKDATCTNCGEKLNYHEGIIGTKKE